MEICEKCEKKREKSPKIDENGGTDQLWAPNVDSKKFIDPSWLAKPVRNMSGHQILANEKNAGLPQATLKIAHISSKDPPGQRPINFWISLQISYKTKVLTSLFSESKFFLLE